MIFTGLLYKGSASNYFLQSKTKLQVYSSITILNQPLASINSQKVSRSMSDSMMYSYVQGG